jgi:hypothetical protein
VRASSNNSKPVLKKQSSFLIERNKSMLEVEMEADNDNRGFFNVGENPRITK